jgi:hypothetical protein
MRMVLRQVIEEDPRSPRSLNADIPLDLETICETAMLKEVDQRYQTADKLAQELGRYLRGEPIEARPITRGGQASFRGNVRRSTRPHRDRQNVKLLICVSCI